MGKRNRTSHSKRITNRAKAGPHSSALVMWKGGSRLSPGLRIRKGRSICAKDIRIIATDLGFPEGPVWMADGSVILGEISGKKVTRVAPDGTKTEIGKAGGGPNGCATGPTARSMSATMAARSMRRRRAFCRPGRRRLQERIDPAHRPQDRRNQDLYTECNGHKLSAPNDIVFDRQGGFYFTDLGKRFAYHRDNGGLYYALAGRVEDRRAGLSAADPERGRAVAGRKDRLCRRYRKLAPLRVRHRRAGVVKKEHFPAPFGGRLSAAFPAFSVSTASRSRPPAISASQPWSPAISR